MNIKILHTYEEISSAFDAFLELRPHLPSKEHFITQVMEQQKEGYTIAGVIEKDDIVACIGFRVLTTLAWGKILYIDDLSTKEKARGNGYAKGLLDYAITIARKHLCKEVHLDTGYTRHTAHTVYLKQGFKLTCHHLALKLT